MLNVQTFYVGYFISLLCKNEDIKKRLKNKPLFIIISLQKLLFALPLNALVRFFSGLDRYLKRD